MSAKFGFIAQNDPSALHSGLGRERHSLSSASHSLTFSQLSMEQPSHGLQISPSSWHRGGISLQTSEKSKLNLVKQAIYSNLLSTYQFHPSFACRLCQWAPCTGRLRSVCSWQLRNQTCPGDTLWLGHSTLEPEVGTWEPSLLSSALLSWSPLSSLQFLFPAVPLKR